MAKTIKPLRPADGCLLRNDRAGPHHRRRFPRDNSNLHARGRRERHQTCDRCRCVAQGDQTDRQPAKFRSKAFSRDGFTQQRGDKHGTGAIGRYANVERSLVSQQWDRSPYQAWRLSSCS